MRIFVWPQYGMRSYEAKKGWLLAEDGHMNQFLGMARVISEHEWNIAVPEPWLCSTCPKRPENVKFLVFPWMDNVQQGRFFFPLRDVVATLQGRRPDVVICEVPELVSNMRMALKMADVDAPIVSMITHFSGWSETIGQGLPLRQFEGYEEADMNVFTHASVFRKFHEMAEETIVRRLHGESTIWEATWDPSQLDADRRERRKIPTVFFISRLSDERRTNYELFFDAANELHTIMPYDLWFANPNDSMTEAQISQRLPWWKGNPWPTFTPTRREYLRALWQAHVVPILYDTSRILSYGFYEALYAGCVVPTPLQDNEADRAGLNVAMHSSALAHAMRNGLIGTSDAVSSVNFGQMFVERKSVYAGADQIRSTLEEVVK